MEKIRERVEKFKEKAADNPKIDDFLNKYTNRVMLQQRLMDGLEKKFSDDPEKLQKMEQVREKVMENFGEIINKLEDKDKIADRLDKITEDIEGSQYKNFKNLEVLLELENKVPEQAKEAIQKAQENALKRLHGDLNNMSPEDQEKFSDYLEKIGGNQALQLRAVEKLKEKESSNNVNKILNQIEEKVQQRVNTTKSENLPEKESGATICPMYWAPVCGKDNKTYSNIVCAKASGVEVAYSGECRVEGPVRRSGCKNLCGDGKCQQVVCMAIGCPCAETIATCPQDCKPELENKSNNSIVSCKNLWWYDSQHKTCQQPKKFCGAYMYSGLHTFETKTECERSLLEAK
jgi:flagellar biosynthesis/type III secretory pathway chaperone